MKDEGSRKDIASRIAYDKIAFTKNVNVFKSKIDLEIKNSRELTFEMSLYMYVRPGPNKNTREKRNRIFIGEY